MIKPIKSPLCLLLVSAMLFAGCSSGDSKQDSETTTEAVTETFTDYPQETMIPDIPASPDSAIDDSKIKLNTLEIKNNLNEIESTLDNLISYHGFLGSVYAKLGNDFEYLHANGIANKGAHINNSVYTRFYTGSVTKLLTAVAVMKLSEEKKLSLDSNIDKYFPDCSYGKSVTIKQLLTMTSGIPDYVVSSEIFSSSNVVVAALSDKVNSGNSFEKNHSAILGWILSQKLTDSKTKKFSYSDSNYYLLGEIIAKASGKSYEKYIDDTVFKPLYMTKSGFVSDESTARPYVGNSKSSVLLSHGAGYSSLGFISNVSDLLKFIDGLMSYQIINKDSFNAIITDYGDGYGYGAFVNGDRVSCIGKTDAFSAKLSFTTDKSQIFVALTNNSESDPNFIHRLFRNYLVKFRN